MNKIPFEKNIRKELARNLSKYLPGLELIEEEFHLQNPFGSKGFIDILARDNENHLVIIELKRSRSSSRQAIQEVLKYISLLSIESGVKTSEIRSIVMSTDWNDLLVPFSKILIDSDYSLEGMKIIVNNKSQIIKMEQIKPVEISSQERFLIKEGHIYLFGSKQSLDKAISQIQLKMSERNVEDFVILHIENTYYDHRHMPYMLYFTIQRHARELYINAIKDDPKLNDYYEDCEIDGDNCLIEELEGFITDCMDVEFKDYMVGYPERLNQFIKHDKWTIKKIIKNGRLSKDPRLSDELLTHELYGNDGSSNIWYNSTFKLNRKAKYVDFVEKYPNCLEYNSFWREQIAQITKYIETLNTNDVTMQVNIYNPDNILETIHHTITSFDDTSSMPIFTLSLHDSQSTTPFEAFYGELVWQENDKVINPDKLACVFFKNDWFREYFQMGVNFHGIKKMNPDIVEHLGLKYSLNHVIVSNGGSHIKKNVLVSNGEVTETGESFKTFKDFLLHNKPLGHKLISLYERYTQDIGNNQRIISNAFNIEDFL